MSSAGDASYHGVGLTFLTICPVIGASVFFFGGVKNGSAILNGFAGGVLLGFALLHALPDGVDGISSSYPYAYLIAGSTAFALIAIAALIAPLVFYVFQSNKFTNTRLINAYSLWCGLLVHGCFEGLATGGLKDSSRWLVIGVLFPHKIVEYAALACELTLTGVNTRSTWFWLAMMFAEVPTMVCFVIAWMAVNRDVSISDDAGAHFTSGTVCSSSSCFVTVLRRAIRSSVRRHVPLSLTRAPDS